jgi:hypothetical protein
VGIFDPDPIFAAIDRHRAACKALAVAALQADEVAARLEHRAADQAEINLAQVAGEAVADAVEDMITKPPTTLVGIREQLAYVAASVGTEFAAKDLAASLLLSSPLRVRATNTSP